QAIQRFVKAALKLKLKAIKNVTTRWKNQPV
ncbi:peptidase U32 family protein, partial [Vibrio parahaemolyticus V-223/04]